MMYTTTITSKGQITLPKAIRDFLGLAAQDKVTFVKMGSEVLVRPKPTLMDLAGSLKPKTTINYTDELADEAMGKAAAKEYEEELRNSGH